MGSCVLMLCVAAAQEAKRILGCINRSVVSRLRKILVSLSSHETPTWSISVLSSRRTWSCWSETEEGHEDDQRMIRDHPYGERLREVGMYSPGEKKALWRGYGGTTLRKGSLQENWRMTLSQKA